MANWKDIAGASKSINKTDSIDMKPENRDCMESVMVALAAAGRVQEMALVAQTLEKIETKANLSATIQDLGIAIHELREAQKQPEPVVTDTYKTDMAAGLAAIGDRLDALETK